MHINYAPVRILFILKKREGYWGGATSCVSSGLSNSVAFVVGMLTAIGIEAAAVEVQDNNGIDAEVTAFQPTHVIIEAFWVVPEKFDELKPLHPNVAWIVRNHSEVPFLANEGIAFGWIAGYLARGVEVMCNAPRALADLRGIAGAYGFSDRMVTYGPNYYPQTGWTLTSRPDADLDTLKIGCFGAIRPLKNTMAQALAAIGAARALNMRLEFHVNATRLEGNGDPILKNLRQMFEAAPQHVLIEHEWLPHTAFCDLIATMDVAMQVSFSETFNIVAADAVDTGIPVVVSSEVPWLRPYAHANPTSVPSMTRAVIEAASPVNYNAHAARLAAQSRDLAVYCRSSEHVWLQRFSLADA